MQVDISFAFAKVYNINEKVDVVLGQKFSLLTDSGGGIHWFAENDAVLAITEFATSADLEATAIGTSVILIMDGSLGIIKKLVINVVDAILAPAKTLSVTADSPVPKV